MDNPLNDITNSCLIFTLGAASLYLLSTGDVRLYEVKAFVEDFHSWFIDQTVQSGENTCSDDSLILIDPVIVFFVLIQYPGLKWANTSKKMVNRILAKEE